MTATSCRTDHPLVVAFSESYAAVNGVRPEFKFSYGISDANVFTAAGIPTLLFGPYGENMHAADEWVDIDQMVKGARRLQRFHFAFPVFANLKTDAGPSACSQRRAGTIFWRPEGRNNGVRR